MKSRSLTIDKDPLWENKIVDHTEEEPSDLLANPMNFRIHTKLQNEATTDSLNKLGWVKSVIVNKRTQTILDGHQRVTLAMRKEGQKIPVTWVDLSEEEEATALLSLDFIVGMAGIDYEKLSTLAQSVDVKGENGEFDWLDDFTGEGIDVDDNYTRKIESPTYLPNNEKPPLTDLYDNSKTIELVAEINAATGISNDEKEFLAIAAQRHTVIDYGKVADYYAHSDETMQALMENSALVIIDFNRAIELGFVTLTEQIAELVKKDHE